jgi:outer membrane protein assembly factor BamB
VYRSTSSGFTPDASSLQVACVPQSFWIDTAVAAGATYYYVVRAENPSTGGFGPCYGGAEDNNLVERSATVSSSCVAAPQEVLYFSASARDLEVQLEWVNPSGAYGLTRTCWRTGSYPTGPTDGVCVDLVGGAGSYGTTTHDTTSVGGISNGQLYFYAAFVNSSPLGTGDWSTGRFVAARPFDTTGAGKWGYSTAATTMSSPGILPGSASFTASNDRILHSSVAGGAGGNWPSAWVPASMNGPAQDRPIVIPFGAPTVGGASTVAFVGSQDGRAYAFNADTGVELWASDVLGNGVQGSPSGSLTVFGGFHDLIIVGTRTPGGDSQLHGLQLVDGAPAWTFDNGGGSNGIGIISSQPWVDGDTTLATFTSRRKAGGSSDTVWCVEFTATSASLLWSRDLGDIDSAPTVLGGAVFVGTNAGTVYALDPLTGADLWATPYATGDGPIRGYVWFDGTGGGRRLFFSTSSSVHGLTDNGSSSTALWAPVSLADPSPVLVIGDDLYLGSSAANGSLVRLDTTTGVQLGSVTLGDPFVAKNVGSPSYDWVTGQVVVGTEQGVVYAVDDGF